MLLLELGNITPQDAITQALEIPFLTYDQRKNLESNATVYFITGAMDFSTLLALNMNERALFSNPVVRDDYVTGRLSHNQLFAMDYETYLSWISSGIRALITTGLPTTAILRGISRFETDHRAALNSFSPDNSFAIIAAASSPPESPAALPWLEFVVSPWASIHPSITHTEEPLSPQDFGPG